MAFDRLISSTMPPMQAGGPALAALKNIYGAQNQGLENKYYVPIHGAQVASQLAYANLMGPQFLSKLMGNQDILANMSPEQRSNALQMVYNAGSGQGTGNALMNNMQHPSSMMGGIINNIKNAFGFGDNSAQSNQQPTNALTQQPNGMNQQNGSSGSNNYQYDNNGNNIKASPQEVADAANRSYGQVQNPMPNQNSFAENAGTYAGIKDEGAQAGKIRANDIKDLNDTVFNADTKLSTLNDINDMISSPEIRQIRQLPLAGRHEFAYYAKEGTPEQQQLVGRITSQMGNVVKDSARDFAGQFRKGEQQLLTGMKLNDSDTVDSMIGKQESLTTMTKMLRERSALTSQYMNQYHINKLQASEMADKQVNGDKIRQQVHDKLNPTVNVRNKKTGETKTMSVNDARQLGVPNV